MLRLLTKIVFLFLAVNICAAQDDPAADGQLTDQFEANNYFAEQARQVSRDNAEKLTAIDKAYSEAVAALSAENVKRTQAIFSDNSDAHKALAEKGLQGSKHTAEVNRIQAATEKARAELRGWYESEMQGVRDEHASQRTAQLAATEALNKQLGEQRTATLQRLLSGPVDLENLPALTFPDADEAAGSAIQDPSDVAAEHTGGIDVAGTVPQETLADDIVTNSNAERFALHERLFREEKERRRRAEEEVASQQNFIQTAQARAHTTASASKSPREPNCETRPDADGDGVYDIRCGGSDCDDNNPNRYPGNTEVGDADHVDEDCDPATFGNVDRDGDGYISAFVCNSDGLNLNCGNDCDDSRASVHPGAPEICNYINDDCDSKTDEGVLATKYLDRDGDSHGDPAQSLFACAQTKESPYGGDFLSEFGNDCDDTDPDVWRGCSQ